MLQADTATDYCKPWRIAISLTEINYYAYSLLHAGVVVASITLADAKLKNPL